MTWIDEKISEYYKWLRDTTVIREDAGTGWAAISTPFVGMFNDCIEIFVKKVSESEFILSDDGETLRNLSLSGVEISRSRKRNEYLQKVLMNHGVDVEKGEIVCRSNGADFARKKHSLISAIMSVSDMDMLANDSVKSMFSDDVLAFVKEKDLLITPSFMIRGKSGLDFTFDFQIAGKKTELVAKSFNTLRQNNVESFLFCLGDTKDARESITGKELRNVAIINDVNQEPSQKLLGAIKSYGADVMLWSEKNTPRWEFRVA